MKTQTLKEQDNKLESIIEKIRNSSVTEVDFGCNQIGDAGASTIAEALKVNKTVTKVNLGYNGIGDAGASTIAEALKVNKTITIIKLGYNEIGDAGASAIAEALKINKTVTQLDLVSNRIGNTGASTIAEALKVNKTITIFNLRVNKIRAQEASAISKDINQIIIRNINNLEAISKFINEKFLTNNVKVNDIMNDNNKIDTIIDKNNEEASVRDLNYPILSYHDIHYYKLYQIVSKSSLVLKLININQSSDKINKQNAYKIISGVDKFILDNYFTLTGICKHLNNEKGKAEIGEKDTLHNLYKMTDNMESIIPDKTVQSNYPSLFSQVGIYDLPAEILAIIINFIGDENLWAIKYIKSEIELLSDSNILTHVEVKNLDYPDKEHQESYQLLGSDTHSYCLLY